MATQLRHLSFTFNWNVIGSLIIKCLIILLQIHNLWSSLTFLDLIRFIILICAEILSFYNLLLLNSIVTILSYNLDLRFLYLTNIFIRIQLRLFLSSIQEFIVISQALYECLLCLNFYEHSFGESCNYLSRFLFRHFFIRFQFR